MIEQLAGVPGNVAAFRASGEVTKEDFKKTVLPVIDKMVKKFDELNYLMLIDTPLKNFTGGAWIEDMLIGFKKLTKWHRVAILTDLDTVNWFTDVFSYLVPGEYKGFYPEQLPTAIDWVSGKEIQP
ncbi:MAG: STAS/SEC14 domain-containing protein [Chitinophagaceae bacterium]